MQEGGQTARETGLMDVFFLGFFQSLGTLVKLLVSEPGIGSPFLTHREARVGRLHETTTDLSPVTQQEMKAHLVPMQFSELSLL